MVQDSAVAAPTAAQSAIPIIHTITIDDVSRAFALAIRDLRAEPVYGLLIGAAYAVTGMLVLWSTFGSGLVYLAYPMVAGALLIGPFMAVGLYEVSRRREAGEPISWSVVMDAAYRKAMARLGWMPMLTLFAFIIWIDVAVAIYAVFFGISKIDPIAFAQMLFNSAEGVLFIVIGNAAGAFFAGALFSMSVIAYPMLLDRDTDFITAIVTSFKAVKANPGPMAAFAITIVFLFAVAAGTIFTLLIAALPLLGHATWHLYRATISYPPDGQG